MAHLKHRKTLQQGQPEKIENQTKKKKEAKLQWKTFNQDSKLSCWSFQNWQNCYGWIIDRVTKQKWKKCFLTCLISPTESCFIVLTIWLCITCGSWKTWDNWLTGPYGNLAPFINAFHSALLFFCIISSMTSTNSSLFRTRNSFVKNFGFKWSKSSLWQKSLNCPSFPQPELRDMKLIDVQSQAKILHILFEYNFICEWY